VTRAVFVGRSEEIARGQSAIDDASKGRGGLLLFSGEAGIGKTRVADEIASLAEKLVGLVSEFSSTHSPAS
jgi:predicted ATPase